MFINQDNMLLNDTFIPINFQVFATWYYNNFNDYPYVNVSTLGIGDTIVGNVMQVTEKQDAIIAMALLKFK